MIAWLEEEFDACREAVRFRLTVVEGTAWRFCRTTDKNFYRGKIAVPSVAAASNFDYLFLKDKILMGK